MSSRKMIELDQNDESKINEYLCKFINVIIPDFGFFYSHNNLSPSLLFFKKNMTYILIAERKARLDKKKVGHNKQ